MTEAADFILDRLTGAPQLFAGRTGTFFPNNIALFSGLASAIRCVTFIAATIKKIKKGRTEG